MNNHSATQLSINLQTALDRSGISIRELSRRSGVPESTIRNILNSVSESPRGITVGKLAMALDLPEEALVPRATTPVRGPNEVRLADVPYINSSSLPRDVPVLGTVAGSELGKGAFSITDDIVDYVRRPPGLAGAKDAYALFVEGDSMVPRFEPGELVFVHPHRKVLTNDYVVVQEPDTDNGEPRGFIKQFVKLSPKLLHTRQFNPASDLSFVVRPGLKWHKVIVGNELYGV